MRQRSATDIQRKSKRKRSQTWKAIWNHMAEQLLVAQSNHWIEMHGASRCKITGEQCRGTERD